MRSAFLWSCVIRFLRPPRLRRPLLFASGSGGTVDCCGCNSSFELSVWCCLRAGSQFLLAFFFSQ